MDHVVWLILIALVLLGVVFSAIFSAPLWLLNHHQRTLEKREAETIKQLE